MTLSLRERYAAGRGYLGAATLGLPVDVTREAVRRDLEKWSTGTADVVEYTALVESARGHAATLLGTDSSRVAIGATASAFVALAAAAVPPGAEVVVVEGDFASVVRPFLARGDLRVVQVPLAGLAEAIGPETWLAAYALVQSATGEVADAASIRSAAASSGARVLVDTTQATGWLPTADLDADVIVCHAYKWLCAPRGSAFAAFSARAQEEIRPLTAGWYSAPDPWSSCYGPELDLAPDASRYDLSPAWHAWVGAEAALGFAVSLDPGEVRAHGVGLANAFRAHLGLGPSDSAIVTWADPDGADLAAMTAAGIAAAGRAGRARVAFHLWNDEEDVELTAAALHR
ncbi:MAG: aminotransferase class V-fold PLP-dependent enzyme [Nocardioides sp.]